MPGPIVTAPGTTAERRRIYLIRHGETDSNAGRVVQVPSDPLSRRGMAQAARLAERIAGYGIRRLISSDFRRAALTAEKIEKSTGISVEFTEILHERNFGDLRGTPYEELETDPFAADYEPPGGESWEVFHERVRKAWDEVQHIASVDEPVAVVTHGLVLRSILARHLGVDVDAAQTASTALGIPNTSVTTVEWSSDGWRVQAIACIEHLDGLPQDGGVA
jgi:broad specificity phosphatase PhoE